MPRVSQVSHYGRPEYSAVRCLLFGANLTDVGILRYVCLLFPDGKNILAYSDVRVTKSDFSAVHRISKENTVICAFLNKNLRNKLYDSRLNMRFQADASKRLFVTENLTRSKSDVFNRLLQLKRSGRVWTVFSKAGIPCYKASKLSAPIRVHNMKQVIDAERDLPPAGSVRARPFPGGGSSSAPPPSAGPGRPAGPARSVLGRGAAPPGRPERGGGGSGPPADLTGPRPTPGGMTGPVRPATAGAAAISESRLAGGSADRPSSRLPDELRESAVVRPSGVPAAVLPPSPRTRGAPSAVAAPPDAATSSGEVLLERPAAAMAVGSTAAAPGSAGDNSGTSIEC